MACGVAPVAGPARAGLALYDRAGTMDPGRHGWCHKWAFMYTQQMDRFRWSHALLKYRSPEETLCFVTGMGWRFSLNRIRPVGGRARPRDS
jgi:hypothetical protein